MSTTGLRVKHNIEVAHRLFLLPGKCERIHGHSMWVDLLIVGEVDKRTGLLAGLDFAEVKKSFRKYLDDYFDHSLLLNEDDTWANYDLPGLRKCIGDPTTENIARWVGEAAQVMWGHTYGVHAFTCEVQETRVNAAIWSSS
jgi:6-pyruvoyltetrahydropterin/6-carboxytetrahydropterin synthase